MRELALSDSKDLVPSFLRMSSHECITLDCLVEPKFNNFRYLYYLGWHVHKLMHTYCVSFDYVMEKIRDYYDNKEQYLLKQMYSFQDDYVRSGHDVRELVNMDFSFCSEVIGKPRYYLTDDELMILDSYGINQHDIMFGTDFFSYDKTKEFKDMVSKNNEYMQKNAKIKDANDYIEKHHMENHPDYQPQIHYHRTGNFVPSDSSSLYYKLKFTI